MQKERWAGAIDVVGGLTLANVLAQTKCGRAVAACSLAGAPTCLRRCCYISCAAALLGVDSVRHRSRSENAPGSDSRVIRRRKSSPT